VWLGLCRRRAEKARDAQFALIKDMVLSGAHLPYVLKDSVDRGTSIAKDEENPYERGMWSFMLDAGLLTPNARTKVLRSAGRWLVRAFALFTPLELEAVLKDRFFKDPALTLYQVARMCAVAQKEVDKYDQRDAFNANQVSSVRGANRCRR
jgi:hypothetical protein